MVEVRGPGAVAMPERLVTGKIDKSVGSVTYTLALDEAGGHGGDDRVELTEGPADVTVDDRDLVPVASSAAAQHLPETVGTGDGHLRRHRHDGSLPTGGGEHHPRPAQTEKVCPVSRS